MKNVLSRSYQRGLSMIEVLVAVVIISLGLLGMAGLQASGMRTSQSAFYRAQAAQFTNDMAERMRANLGDARNYTLALTATAPTGTSVRDRDRADWLARVATLPAGDGSIAVDLANNTVSIAVQWDDTRAGGAANANYTLVTRLWNN
ncbi:MAG TPA: type IV pilus modification protein PilV [Burkholderiaceae bacterium]|nr:type IV pilus modification protein PilV [Burkholderiaceae bacterium]